MRSIRAQKPFTVDFPSDMIEIADREYGAFHIVTEIAEHSPQIPFRLTQFGPRISAERKLFHPFRRASVFSLAHSCMGDQTFQSRFQFLYMKIGLIRICTIPMINKPGEKLFFPRGFDALQALFEKPRVGSGEGETGDPGIRNNLPDDLRCPDIEIRDHFRCMIFVVRFIPHSPVTDFVFVAESHCFNPAVPRGKSFCGYREPAS